MKVLHDIDETSADSYWRRFFKDYPRTDADYPDWRRPALTPEQYREIAAQTRNITVQTVRGPERTYIGYDLAVPTGDVDLRALEYRLQNTIYALTAARINGVALTVSYNEFRALLYERRVAGDEGQAGPMTYHGHHITVIPNAP